MAQFLSNAVATFAKTSFRYVTTQCTKIQLTSVSINGHAWDLLLNCQTSVLKPWQTHGNKATQSFAPCLGVCASVQITHSKESTLVAENTTVVATQKRLQEMGLDSPPAPAIETDAAWVAPWAKGRVGNKRWNRAHSHKETNCKDVWTNGALKTHKPSSPHAPTVFVNIYLKSMRNREQNAYNALEHL